MGIEPSKMMQGHLEETSAERRGQKNSPADIETITLFTTTIWLLNILMEFHLIVSSFLPRGSAVVLHSCDVCCRSGARYGCTPIPAERKL